MKRRNVGSILLLASLGGLPLMLSAQMPPQSCKLVITSEPTGAVVTIDGKPMKQRTDATFVVYAGTYEVSAASSDGSLICPAVKLVLVEGETLTRKCTSAGWK